VSFIGDLVPSILASSISYEHVDEQEQEQEGQIIRVSSAFICG
jgi:hypothetical protein